MFRRGQAPEELDERSAGRGILLHREPREGRVEHEARLLLEAGERGRRLLGEQGADRGATHARLRMGGETLDRCEQPASSGVVGCGEGGRDHAAQLGEELRAGRRRGEELHQLLTAQDERRHGRGGRGKGALGLGIRQQGQDLPTHARGEAVADRAGGGVGCQLPVLEGALTAIAIPGRGHPEDAGEEARRLQHPASRAAGGEARHHAQQRTEQLGAAGVRDDLRELDEGGRLGGVALGDQGEVDRGSEERREGDLVQLALGGVAQGLEGLRQVEVLSDDGRLQLARRLAADDGVGLARLEDADRARRLPSEELRVELTALLLQGAELLGQHGREGPGDLAKELRPALGRGEATAVEARQRLAGDEAHLLVAVRQRGLEQPGQLVELELGSAAQAGAAQGHGRAGRAHELGQVDEDAGAPSRGARQLGAEQVQERGALLAAARSACRAQAARDGAACAPQERVEGEPRPILEEGRQALGQGGGIQADEGHQRVLDPRGREALEDRRHRTGRRLLGSQRG